MKVSILPISFLVFAATTPALHADSISVNLAVWPNSDDQVVDPGESAVVGIAGAESVDGVNWNHIELRGGDTPGIPVVFTAATQGGDHIDLIDSSGADSGVEMTSSGSFSSNFANVSTPAQGATGDAGLMQSYLLLRSSESVTLSGLLAWAPNGYRVVAFFDIGSFTRSYGISMSDGGTSQIFWTADTAESDADPDNDGVISWLATTASTSGTAIPDANYAVYGPFAGDSLVISGEALGGFRATLSGLQIIANNDPPPTIVSFTASPEIFAAGETVSLGWEVLDADSVSIDQGIGPVAATGTLDRTPVESTAWTLTATRGTTTVTARAMATPDRGPIDVYLLGGQSNMAGTGRTSKLPAELLAIPEILLYADGDGVDSGIVGRWVGLQPSGGETFGPEIGLGEPLRDLCPGRPMAFIKYSVDAASLEIEWNPGADAADTANWGPQFVAFVDTVNDGIAGLRADGWRPVIVAMLWQQGEEDAKDGLDEAESDHSADDYGANLAHFVSRVRGQFTSLASPDGIRFVAGQVLPYAPPGGDVEARFPGRALVRQAILDADEDSGTALSIPNSAAVPTNETDHPSHAQEIDGHRDSDEVHLNATALLKLGRSMAHAVLRLTPLSYADWSAAHFVVGGPDDDDDFDGLSNWIEYGLGGNPTDSGDAPYPWPRLVEFGGDGYQSYAVRRNLEAAETVLRAEFSTDLLDWTSHQPVFVSSAKQSDGTTILVYRSPWPTDDPDHPDGFFRTSVADQ